MLFMLLLLLLLVWLRGLLLAAAAVMPTLALLLTTPFLGDVKLRRDWCEDEGLAPPPLKEWDC
jgi:hypothetical protein